MPDETEITIHPRYCEWVELQDSPNQIEFWLHHGKAEMNDKGVITRMQPGVHVLSHGLISVHNIQQSDQGLGPDETPDTEIHYKSFI